MSVRGSVLLIALLFAAMQIFVLPPDGFVTGDQGSKFLQTRAFAVNGPLNPSIEVAARDIDPDYRHQEPKLKNRRGRLVSEFLWLLPLLSAPFYALFGMRGLYVVPALSAIVVFLAAAALGRRMGDPTGVWTAWITVIATPVVVYGLELWEHTPAAACVIVAAALAWPMDLPPEGGSHERKRLAFAGAAIMIGFLFREEVVSAFPAIAIARAACVDRDRVQELVRTALWMGVGAAAVFLASVPMNLLIYGAPLPMHITQDAWEVAKNTPYMQVRRDVVVDLLLPGSNTILFLLAAGAGLAASWAQARRQRANASLQHDEVSRQLLNVVHACMAVLLIVAIVLPLWHVATERRVADAYRTTSVVHTWPFVLAILYLPWTKTDTASGRTARFLIVTALVTLAGSALVVPTSGGGQWSPRFLIASAPLLAVAAAAPAIGRRQAVAWTARAILAGSLAMQLTGIALFAHVKSQHAQLTAWVATRTAPGSVLITDIFWFHELTATLSASRRTLFSWQAADVPALAGVAVQHGLTGFAVVSSVPLTGYDPPPVLDVPGASCRFVRGQRVGLDRAGLTLSRYGCEGP